MCLKSAFILWLLCLPYLAWPQETGTLWFHHLQNLPNFSSSYNYFIYHDTEGFTWISSTAGLNRFDGTRVKHYSALPGDTTSIFEDNIQSTFFEDKRKNLWFSTGSSFQCYDRQHDNFRRFFVTDSIQSNYYAFFLEKDTFLWVRVSKAIYRFNIHHPHEIALVDTVSMDNWYKVDTAADGSVIMVYPVGRLDLNDFQYLEIRNGKVNARKNWFRATTVQSWPTQVFDLYRQYDTLAWIGTDKGLLAWNPQNGNIRKIRGTPSGSCHFVPWQDPLMIVWAPENGLFLFDRHQEQFTNLNIQTVEGNQLSPETFASLYLDKKDNLWIPFFNNGLVYANLRKSKFHSLPKIPVPSNGSITYAYWTFLEDRDGNFWYGTDLYGVFCMDNEGQLVSHYQNNPDEPYSLPDNWITGIVQDPAGRLWFGGRKGIAWLDHQRNIFSTIHFGDASVNPDIYDMYRMQNGLILAPSRKNGLLSIKEKSGKHVLERLLNDDRPFITVFEDRSGHIFADRDEIEIEIFHPRKDTLLRLGSIPLSGFISGFYEEEDGKTLWISSTGGLAKVNPGQGWKIDTIFTEKDGLPNKNIHSLLADHDGNLWLGTAKGLVLFQTKKRKFKSYSLADGTQSLEFSFRSAVRRRNGELWFGGSGGITIVRPGNIRDLDILPSVKITGIMINDTEASGLQCEESGMTNIPGISSIRLPYDKNTLSFEFVAIEYSDPANNQLMYMMENVDKNWVLLEKGEPGFARYPNLYEGEYTFLIKGANSDGIWNEIPHVLKIRIDPPFQGRWWFLSLVALALTGLVWSGIRYRIKQIKEKADLKTRIAENKMAALRAQMNPHFIFNSLQTVNGLITRQDLRGAIEYVNQFARLMRVILENSRTGMISLEKEIELLELYMKIETKRFSIPFTYHITVGNELDTYSIELPPMLLQPFVENAIKHGLFHQKEPGHINIGFLKDNGYLKCYVEDNGVGRRKSAELNTQQGRGHKSRGLEIVQERLDIIRASNPGDYRVKIIDLYDLQQNPAGTRVEIKLPLS